MNDANENLDVIYKNLNVEQIKQSGWYEIFIWKSYFWFKEEVQLNNQCSQLEGNYNWTTEYVQYRYFRSNWEVK